MQLQPIFGYPSWSYSTLAGYLAKKWIVLSTEIPKAILNTKMVDCLYRNSCKIPIIAAVKNQRNNVWRKR